MPKLVTLPELPAAMSLNTLSMGLSRVIGPAAGAAIGATWGPAATFACAALDDTSKAGLLSSLFGIGAAVGLVMYGLWVRRGASATATRRWLSR